MKNYFPPQNQNFTYLQTNRSDDLGSIWSSFNLDFQSNLGSMRLANKLIKNTTSTTKENLGVPCAFEFFYGSWWSIVDTRIFRNGSNLCTSNFSEDDNSGWFVGDSTTQFDITKSGNTVRYTYDNTGTNPDINSNTFPTGATVNIWGDNFHESNNLNATITASGSKYFEITNAGGTAENDKTLGTDGYIAVVGGTRSTGFEKEYSDLAIFNERIWATDSDNLWSKDRYYSSTGGWGHWTRRDRLGSGIHKMAYLEKRDRLYYVDDLDTISSISKTDTGEFYLDLNNANLRITTIEASTEYIWAGTMRVDGSSDGRSSGSKGVIYQWDGISAQVSKSYPLTTAGVMAMCIIKDIPYAIDTEGRILKYTGYSFEEIQRFPIKDFTFYKTTASSLSNKFIHFNGMVPTKDNTILFAINNNLDSNKIAENIPSGVWELDLNTMNLTHKHSITLNAYGSATTTDFGQNRISEIGAIKINSLTDVSTSGGRGSLFVGAEYYTDATTTEKAILIDAPKGGTSDKEGQKRGYFVTTWFNSTEVQDKFARLWDIHKRFLTSTDKIIYKYRIIEEDPIEATITWTSTTSFTTTTNVLAYAPTATGFNGTTGGEVEVLQGTGSGSCTHISNISEAGGTYTVTLDTAVTGVTGTAKARFQKWIKMYPDVTGQIKSWEQLSIGASNTQIQIKGVMEFTGDNEFQRFILTSNEDIKALL